MAVCPAERRVVMVSRTVDVVVVDEKRRMAEMLLDGAQLVKIEKLVDDDEIIGVRTAQRVVKRHIGIEGRKKFFRIPSGFEPGEIDCETIAPQQAGHVPLVSFDPSIGSCKS